jgi:hypothetical protein
MELDKWVAHNPGPWRHIQRDLRNLSEASIGGPRKSPQESAAIIMGVAEQHGMPSRLARLCVTVARS